MEKTKPIRRFFFYTILKEKNVFFLLLILLISSSTFSQLNVLDDLQNRFSANNTITQEKLFVHTDKNFYLTGETIWFKIYAVDANAHKPINISKVAYIEILDGENKPVLQAKVELKKGDGYGSFVLPSSLNSGNYLLRTYTNWMKNFDESFYFQKTLQIINTSKRPDWQSLEKAEAYVVQFFPEGGNMVYGLKSKLGFQSVDQYGKGIEGEGIILNDRNDTVAHFQTLKFGIGSFYFTPQQGNTYKAIIHLSNTKTITAALPKILNEGYVMSVADLNKEQLQITVSYSKNDASKMIYLLVHTRQSIKIASAKELENGKAEWIINKNTLGDGISNFTLFDNNRQPVCERLYFKRPFENMDIDIAADAKEYGMRSKISLNLFIHNQNNEPVKGNLSMSVFLIDSLQKTDENTIDSYIWLTSDLKGRLESPGYYFKNENSETTNALDNLMLTHGWRRFSWNEITTDKKPLFDFLPEYEGFIIKANIIKKKSGNPAAGVLCYLSVPGEKFHLNNAVSNQNGQVAFVLQNVYGHNELVLQTNDADSNFRIELLNPYSEKYNFIGLPHFELPQKWEDQLVMRHLNVQVSNSFSTSTMQQFSLPVTDTFMFYGKPDGSYLLDEFTRFPTMEEVMREFVTFVRPRKEKDAFHFEVLNIPYQLYFASNPLVLLDGVPVYDLNKIIAFDPLKVKKIEVVARKYFFGNAILNGIVSYTTYDGDLANFELDPNAVILEYNGLQVQREFYSPVYNTNENLNGRIPDTRNVLLWNPNVSCNDKGTSSLSFYTSDVSGKFAIMVQGTDSSGKAGSNVITFSVK